MTEESGSLQVPGKLKRTMKKLAAAGEELVQIAPAILQSQATDQMMAIARLGMMDKILGYLVTTNTNVHFVRPGLAWDKVQTVPLEKINGVEYVNEFHNNTLSLKVGERSENIIFYDDMDGIKFYHFIKSRQWQN
jgi:hypothetical protein